ncbi:MAG: hypothetical protein EBZ93_12880 [Actinobacteria bacterium]|nr:hypothetical protein [Actinomycetota bacterium]
MSAMRTRWAAIGAAVAVTLGGGGFFVANAGTTTPNADDAAYHPVTPVRVLDTRRTDAVSNGVIKLDVEGPIATINSNGTTTSVQVAPTTASAVAINLTVTEGQKNGGYGFVKVYPCTQTTDAAPEASAINFENKVDIANALNVTTSATGEICFSVYGTADLIVDMSGYYDDSRLDDIEADYLDNDDDIIMTYASSEIIEGTFGCTDLHLSTYMDFDAIGSTFGCQALVSLTAPYSIGGRYELDAFSVCIPANYNDSGGYISNVSIYSTDGATPLFSQNISQANASTFWGSSKTCKEFSMPNTTTARPTLGSQTYNLQIQMSDPAGSDGGVQIQSIKATFSPCLCSLTLNPGIIWPFGS